VKDLPGITEQRKEAWRKDKPSNRKLNKEKYRRKERGGKNAKQVAKTHIGKSRHVRTLSTSQLYMWHPIT